MLLTTYLENNWCEIPVGGTNVAEDEEWDEGDPEEGDDERDPHASLARARPLHQLSNGSEINGNRRAFSICFFLSSNPCNNDWASKINYGRKLDTRTFDPLCLGTSMLTKKRVVHHITKN